MQASRKVYEAANVIITHIHCKCSRRPAVFIHGLSQSLSRLLARWLAGYSPVDVCVFIHSLSKLSIHPDIFYICFILFSVVREEQGTFWTASLWDLSRIHQGCSTCENDINNLATGPSICTIKRHSHFICPLNLFQNLFF